MTVLRIDLQNGAGADGVTAPVAGSAVPRPTSPTSEETFAFAERRRSYGSGGGTVLTGSNIHV